MQLSSQGVLALLAVAGLGGLGSVLRLFLSRWDGFLPYGIMLANVLASFIAGFALIFSSAAGQKSLITVFLTMGLAGGLSTFSTFAAQTGGFFQGQERLKGLLNLLGNLLFPPLAVALGVIFASSLLK